MNQLLSKDIEAHIVNASALLWLEELKVTQTPEYIKAFCDGFMFRSEMIRRLREIYFGYIEYQDK